jgi:hypothetical protein
MAVRPKASDHLEKGGVRSVSLVEIVKTPEPERIPVFSLDGVVYTIPGRVPAGLTLQVMEDMGTRGEEAAMVSALRTLMGEEAYTALKTCEYLTSEQLAEILDSVMERITGAVEKARGK